MDNGTGFHFDAEWLIGSLTRSQHLKYVDVGLLAYIIADYFQTLEDEVTYMWKGRWTLVKTLFFVTRYLLFIDIPLTIVFNETLGLSQRACHGLFGTTCLLCVAATGIAEAIMFMRVYALSKQTKSIGMYLAIQYAATQIANVALFIVLIRTLGFAAFPRGPMKYPCIPVRGVMDQLSAIFAVVLLNQIVVTALSFYFVFVNFHGSWGPLVHMLYQDGVFYFVIMSSISIVNFTMSRTMTREHQFLAALIQRTLHATLTIRIVLRMRASARMNIGSSLSLSDMHFNRSKTTWTAQDTSGQASSFTVANTSAHAAGGV